VSIFLCSMVFDHFATVYRQRAEFLAFECDEPGEWQPFTMKRDRELWVGKIGRDASMVVWLGRWKPAAARLAS